MSILTYKGQMIEQRGIDGYVNATQMCNANGKKVNDWLRTADAKRYIQAISTVTGIPVTVLVVQIAPDVNKGIGGGTWIHPKLAIKLGRWISVEFELWCDDHIKTLIETGHTQLAESKPKGLFERLKVILERSEVPKGYWIVGTQIQNFLSTVENDYLWSEHEWFDLVDQSVGRCWSLHLSNINSPWVDKRIHVTYHSPIKVLDIWAYSYKALPDFRYWFDEVYEPIKFPAYIKRKQKLGHLLPNPQKLLA